MNYGNITISADDFCMTEPENITIKRNLDGTYNFYALIRSQYTENNKQIKSLVGLKSDNLRYDRDIDLTISFQTDSTTIQDFLGRTLHVFDINKRILYNLNFSKNADILCEFQILNKGEGIMDYNVFEGLENYTVQVNVAGFTKEELDIILEDGIIRIKAKPTSMLTIEDDDCISKSFEKYKSECEIFLPNVESVNAELKNGILYLNIPKISKGIKIEIK